MSNKLRENLARSTASLVAGTIIGIARLVYAVLSMIFGILLSLAG